MGRVSTNAIDSKTCMRNRHPGVNDSLVVFLVLVLLLSIGCAASSGKKQEGPREQTLRDVEEVWGIKILGIRQTAAGYMLDFRFRILDPDKASPLLHPTVKPYLIDQTSGLKLGVPAPPKVGALRQRSGRTATGGWTSFILFSNPGRIIKPAGRVTVVIGSLQIENLVVE